MTENFGIIESVNMNDSGTFGYQITSQNIDNPLMGIQLPPAEVDADMDLLSETFKTPETSSPEVSMKRSASDLDLDYEGFHFEDIPSMAGESDTDLSYHSSSSDHDESHDEHSAGQKKYRQPAALRAVNLTIGPWVCTSRQSH